MASVPVRRPPGSIISRHLKHDDWQCSEGWCDLTQRSKADRKVHHNLNAGVSITMACSKLLTSAHPPGGGP